MTDGYQTPPPGYPPQPPPPYAQQQPYAQEQPYAPQPPAPRPKSRAPVVLIVLGLVGVLAVCGCIGAVVLFGAFSGGSDVEPWKPTADQSTVLAEFGPPETFTLMWMSDVTSDTPEGEDPPLVRLETWNYHLLGSSFTFRNGMFVKRVKTPVPKGDVVSAALRPDSFTAGMSPDDVTDLIGVDPDRVARVLPDRFEGLEVYAWRGQVVAGFQDGKLALVQTIPVTQTEGGGS
ncbi:MAG: hypothetical protein C0418_05410 [Coriobacteriaceae bacterium]|nr:hypothetical protein [Coriobacteriaceae bacterium]